MLPILWKSYDPVVFLTLKRTSIRDNANAWTQLRSFWNCSFEVDLNCFWRTGNLPNKLFNVTVVPTDLAMIERSTISPLWLNFKRVGVGSFLWWVMIVRSLKVVLFINKKHPNSYLNAVRAFNASPLNPNVKSESRSSNVDNLEVECGLQRASKFEETIPDPLSMTSNCFTPHSTVLISKSMN